MEETGPSGICVWVVPFALLCFAFVLSAASAFSPGQNLLPPCYSLFPCLLVSLLFLVCFALLCFCSFLFALLCLCSFLFACLLVCLFPRYSLFSFALSAASAFSPGQNLLPPCYSSATHPSLPFWTDLSLLFWPSYSLPEISVCPFSFPLTFLPS